MLNPTQQASAGEVAVFNHIESLYFILQDFSQKLLPYHGRWDAKDLEEQNEIVALTRFETFVAIFLMSSRPSRLPLVNRNRSQATTMRFHSLFTKKKVIY